MKNAVIYCRVSSHKQVKEGHGLSSQEATCRKYATEQGLSVERVFKDDYTGKGDFWNRNGIKELLQYLDDQNDEFVVIFDDLKRFARDTLFHLKLRQELSARNASPGCPTFRFEDTPEGNFVETIIAATGELERKQNRRQVIRRMQARLEAGYWVFAPPLGYRFSREAGGKMLVPDLPTSEHVKTALEGFANGKLRNKSDVEEFLRTKKCYSRWSRGQTYSLKTIPGFLRNELYCGWCTSPEWDIRVRGKHEPIISEKTHRRILSRLETKPVEFVRNCDREEFPLRGYIQCAACCKNITACWSRGRNRKYPYYRCLTQGCIGSIGIKAMESRFLERLEDAVPAPSIFKLFKAVVRESFSDQEALVSEKRRADRKRLAEIEQDTAALVEAATAVQELTVRRIYEQKIAVLQREKEKIEGQFGNTSEDAIEPVLEQGSELLSNPLEYWQNGNLEKRRVVQNRAFSHPIPFDQNSGYRTAEFSLLYGIFETAGRDESRLVDLLRQNSHPVAEEFERWRKFLKSA